MSDARTDFDRRDVLGVVELDLRSLSVEGRRKFPEVKDAVERALLRIRAIHEQLPQSASAAEQAEALAAEEEVLLPLTLALASKSDTLPELALKAVQRMISHNAVAPQRLPAVVSQLIARAQSPSADEPSLLRVLQTVLTIASSPALLHNDTIVQQLILLCLTLQQHRSGNIRNTAVATVQQFIALLLDIVAGETDVAAEGGPAAADGTGRGGAQRPNLEGLSVAARCTFLAFQDLCLLANGESAQWLPGSGPVRISFALEMVQRTLQSHSELFMNRRPFRYLLKERACPLLLKTMQQPQQEWHPMLRLLHLTATLLSGYAHLLRTEAEIILSMLARTLAADATPIWHRTLILEVFRVLVQHETLLQHIFTSYDVGNAASGVFAKLTASVSKVLLSPAVDFGAHAEYIEKQYLRLHRTASGSSSSARSFSLALYSETDGTGLSSDHMAALAVQCHVLLTHAISRLAEASAVEPQAPPQALLVAHAACGSSSMSAAHHVSPAHSLKAATLGQQEVAKGMVSGCWQALLSSLSLVLARCLAEEAIQIVLKCYQTFTQACGMLDLLKPRDAFLASLCQYAMPPKLAAKAASNNEISFAPVDNSYEPLSAYTQLSAKNVQALKMLFNIAHCLGGLLGPSWNLVFQTLEQLDRIIASSKSTAPATDAAVAKEERGADATSHELTILSTALNNLFSGSSRLSDDAIAHFLAALSTQCFSSLAHEATSKERLVPGASSSSPLRLFALAKFVDVVMHNLHRVLTLWPLVTQLLLPAANHKAQRIRIVGTEALAKVVIAAMRHHMHARAKLKDGAAADAAPAAADAAPAAADAAAPAAAPAAEDDPAWDQTLMAPLEELQRRCVHKETQERTLQALHQILQACGAELRSAWPQLLSILWRTATLPSLAYVLPLGFRSVQLIASDFLSVLPPPCLLAYVEVAAVYATQRKHLNVSLTAIGLQWSIGDFLTRKHPVVAGEDEVAQGALLEEEEREEAEAAAAAAAAAADARRAAAAGAAAAGAPAAGAPAAAAAAAAAAAEAADSEEEEALQLARATAPRYSSVDVETAVSAHELWCASLRQLRALCVDERPEVRTCSMHSLTSVLTAHGASIRAATWDYAMFRTLLPLMSELTHAAASASTTEPVAEQLGTEGGRPVLMMLHHSRNTASKQWDETWVLTLNSVTRLFRTFLPLLQRRPRFEQAWRGLLRFCELSLTSSARSQEVALAAIGALHQLLLSSVASRSSPDALVDGAAPAASAASSQPPSAEADAAMMSRLVVGASRSAEYNGGSADLRKPKGAAATVERLPPALWVAVWGVIERSVATALADARYEVHEKMLTRLLGHFSEVYAASRESFEEADVLRLLQLASKLAAPPEQHAGWTPTAVARLPSPLQLAVHKLLESLPPFPSAVSASNLWPLLMWQLLKFIEPTLPVERAPPPPPDLKLRDSTGFAERAHELLLRLFTEQAQPAAKLVVFEDVMQVFRGVVAWRRHPACACPALPRAVAASMLPLVDAILPQLSAQQQGGAASSAADTVGRAQSELVATLWVLLAPPTAAPASATEGGVEGPPSAQPVHAADGADGGVALPRDLSDEEMQLEMQLLGVACRIIRGCGESMPSALCSRALQLLQAVVLLPAAVATQRDPSWRAAVGALCELSGAVGSGGEASGGDAAAAPVPLAVSRLAAPMLTKAATRILSEWASMSDALADGVLAVRAEQLLHLLSRLALLRLPPDTLGATPGATDALAKPLRGATAHLVYLVPALVACVGRPTRAGAGKASGAEAVQQLQEALREALQKVVDELGFPPLALAPNA